MAPTDMPRFICSVAPVENSGDAVMYENHVNKAAHNTVIIRIAIINRRKKVFREARTGVDELNSIV
jgi:hypothetical protein